ncbi:OpgC domain-containing protein [Rhodovulum sp. MB263]|uniref:OpgC domain-containing protein n=1 Tax=unclassified Rhodovulum TaxID=2631432 RepID=UPI0009B7DDC0|nr:OpgC domain-containing protein [Rhodovulum sp. MB263]ARC89429.1 OpgC protein [Rhodovulum sp. MB263]
MSRPEPVSVPVKRPRDPRIDAFRGLALVMIFIDHVPGNPYEHWTIRNFGFSDAAEAFFVMSGIAAGLAYSGRFAAPQIRLNGLWAAIRPIWGRSWTLYIVHVLLSAWAIAIFAWGAMALGVPELLTKINLRQVFENTAEALIGIPLLTHQFGYVNILPAYSVLLLFAPLAIFIGMRAPRLMVSVAIAIWFVAGMWRLDLPNYPNPGGWFFNPLSWQIIFVLGLLTGIHMRRGERFVARRRWLFWLAVAFLGGVFLWAQIPALGQQMNALMRQAGQAGLPFHLVGFDKTYVSLPRMLHVLALFYVLSCLPAVVRLAGSRVAAPLRLMGRHGLLVFSFGTAVSLLFQVLMAGYPDLALLPWLLPPLGVAAMLVAAMLAQAARREPRRVPLPVAQPVTDPVPEPLTDPVTAPAGPLPEAAAVAAAVPCPDCSADPLPATVLPSGGRAPGLQPAE